MWMSLSSRHIHKKSAISNSLLIYSQTDLRNTIFHDRHFTNVTFEIGRIPVLAV